MLPMNTGSTAGTAALRGLYIFLGTALVAGIGFFMSFPAMVNSVVPGEVDIADANRIVYSILTGILSGLGPLGFRSGAEGLYDANRDAKVAAGQEEPKPSDVGQPNG
jgi:hypothetical protein